VELLLRTPLAARVSDHKLAQVARLAQMPTWVPATGAGRVFEAAGALAGLSLRNEYEGQAAALFEALAGRWHEPVEPWPEPRLGARDELPTAHLLAALGRRLLFEPPARAAAGFHASFCRLAADLAARELPPDVRVIALGGGCLANRLLARGLAHELRARGFDALLPRDLPPGDGGLSYGQAVLGAVALARGREPSLEGAP
jgi:hydrogenase maturation protein HypF